MIFPRYRIKNIATLNDEILYDTTDPETEIKYVEIGDVRFNDGIVNMTDYTYETAPSRARRVVRDGDIIISTVRTYLKAVAPITKPDPNLIVSTGFAVVRPKREILFPAFAGYLLLSEHLLSEVVSRSVGVSYPAVNPEDIGNLEVYLPPLPIQTAIAAYLDKETVRIDALIAKKERQIELLEEKRQATITRAITKGLDPNAKMKDSGVEWIGEIPEGWQTRKLKHFILILSGYSPEQSSPVASTEGIPYYKVDNIQIDSMDVKAPEYYVSESFNIVKDDSLLFPKRGAAIALNKVGIASPPFSIDTNLMGFSIIGALSLKYLYYTIKCFSLIEIADTTTIPQINNKQIETIRIPYPSLSEQNEIEKFLYSILATNSSVQENIEKSILLLREYRSSLITAAVSGQIDVSHEVAQ